MYNFYSWLKVIVIITRKVKLSMKEVTVGSSGYVRNLDVVLSEEGVYSIPSPGGLFSSGVLKKSRY
jgi:hypothetical protein